MAPTIRGHDTQETFGTTSPATGSAPTLATDGQEMKDLDSITVVLSAANGVTLSGAGSLACYVYDPIVAAWARCPSADLTVGTSGVQALMFDPFEVLSARNARVKWVPVGVTFSAGSAGVTVSQLAYMKAAQGRYA